MIGFGLSCTKLCVICFLTCPYVFLVWVCVCVGGGVGCVWGWVCVCVSGYAFRHALRYQAESWHGGR